MARKINVPMSRVTISVPVDVIATAKRLRLNVSGAAVQGIRVEIEKNITRIQQRRSEK